MSATAYTRPKHVGPNVLPNFPLFPRLVGYATREPSTVIRDVTNGFEATHLQLLTDVLHLRNVLQNSLDENTRQRLLNGEEVYFNVLAPGGYEFATAFLAILAIGGVIVPLCMIAFMLLTYENLSANWYWCSPSSSCPRSNILCE